MDWIATLKTLGFTTAGQILFLIVIGFFGKKLIEYFFSETIELKKAELKQGLENHKLKLESETANHKLILDKDLESFKGELNKLYFEHQTKYHQLHTDRAETIKKLFGLLYELETKMESLMRPFQSVNEKPIEVKFQEASISAVEFVSYYKRNEILFNNNTCLIFEKINSSFLNAWNDFKTSREFSSIAQSPELNQKLIDKELNAYYEILLKEIPNLKVELKDDFRKILGVEKD